MDTTERTTSSSTTNRSTSSDTILSNPTTTIIRNRATNNLSDTNKAPGSSPNVPTNLTLSNNIILNNIILDLETTLADNHSRNVDRQSVEEARTQSTIPRATPASGKRARVVRDRMEMVRGMDTRVDIVGMDMDRGRLSTGTVARRKDGTEVIETVEFRLRILYLAFADVRLKS
jgi:hypothetical protein